MTRSGDDAASSTRQRGPPVCETVAHETDGRCRSLRVTLRCPHPPRPAAVVLLAALAHGTAAGRRLTRVTLHTEGPFDFAWLALLLTVPSLEAVQLDNDNGAGVRTFGSPRLAVPEGLHTLDLSPGSPVPDWQWGHFLARLTTLRSLTLALEGGAGHALRVLGGIPWRHPHLHSVELTVDGGLGPAEGPPPHRTPPPASPTTLSVYLRDGPITRGLVLCVRRWFPDLSTLELCSAHGSDDDGEAEEDARACLRAWRRDAGRGAASFDWVWY